MKVRCDGEPGRTCSKCETSDHGCVYRPREQATRSSPSHNGSTQPLLSGSTVSSSSHHVQNSETVLSTFPTTPIGTETMYLALNQEPPDEGSSVAAGNRAPYFPFYKCTDSNAADNFSNLPLDSLYDFIMDSSESYFGWDLSEEETDHMKTLNSNAPNTPPAEWLTANSLHSNEPPENRENTVQPSELLYSSHLIRDAQPTDTPWVSRITLSSMSGLII